MGTYKTKGIIIKRSDLGEADKIITAFSDSDGKIKGKAKGIRFVLAKNAGHLELFNYSDLMMVKSQGEIEKIATASTIESFQNIRKDLKKTALAYYFCELVDTLTVLKEKNKKIFELLLGSLRFLDKNGKKELFSDYFKLNLLSFLGYKPELSFCVHCRKKLEPIDNYFSSPFGGLLCPNCFFKYAKKGVKISKNGVKILRALLSYDLEIINRLKIDLKPEKEVKEVTDNFVRYIAEKEFKSVKFMEKLEEEK